MDISPPTVKYSKYAQSLDRLFKNNSLEVLQQNIKNPKKLRTRQNEFGIKINDKQYKIKIIKVQRGSPMSKCLLEKN